MGEDFILSYWYSTCRNSPEPCICTTAFTFTFEQDGLDGAVVVGVIVDHQRKCLCCAQLPGLWFDQHVPAAVTGAVEDKVN